MVHTGKPLRSIRSQRVTYIPKVRIARPDDLWLSLNKKSQDSASCIRPLCIDILIKCWEHDL